MSFNDIDAYLQKNTTSLVFSSADVAVIVKKCKDETTKVRCPLCDSSNVIKTDQYGIVPCVDCVYYDCEDCGEELKLCVLSEGIGISQ